MRRPLLLGLALALVGIGIVVVLVISPSKVSYQGKPLEFWLEEIDSNKPERRREEARKAIRAIGTNAIPQLIADLRLDEPKWKQVLRQWLSKQSIIRVKYRTLDARSSQATSAFDALGSAGSPAIPELITLLDRNPGYVPAALSWIGSNAVPALTNALNHSNRFVRANSSGAIANAVASGKIPRSAVAGAIPILLQLLQDSDPGLRQYAAWTLGAIREQPLLCVPALTRSLDDPVASVQSASAKSLLNFGPAALGAVPKLTNLFASPDPNVRYIVAGALGAIGESSAVPVLVSGVRDPSDVVRIWTVGALGSIGREPQVSVPALVAALKDSNDMVRSKAAEVLGAFGKEAASAVEALNKAAREDPDQRVRNMARQSLRRIGPDSVPK